MKLAPSKMKEFAQTYSARELHLGEAYLFLVLILAILAFVVDPPQTGNLFFGILFVLTLPLSILAYPLTLWSAFLLFGPAPLGPLGNAFVVFIWEMCAFVQMVVVRMVARSRPR